WEGEWLRCDTVSSAAPVRLRFRFAQATPDTLRASVMRGGATRSPKGSVVPLAGIEPALLAELDFESSASTSSATGAFALSLWPEGATGAAKRADYSGRLQGVNPRGC